MAENDNRRPKDIKLLPCSAEFYVSNQGRNASAYTLVDLLVLGDSLYDSRRNLMGEAKKLGCEVVTDVRYIGERETEFDSAEFYTWGTGLILKLEKDAKDDKEKSKGEQP
jgi:hypothetical protein